MEYKILPDPNYATSYSVTSLTATGVTFGEVTPQSFNADFSNISVGTDVSINLSVTTSNSNVLTSTKTVSVVTFSGVGIQHKYTRAIYTRAEWTAGGFSASDARGIAVGDGTHDLCLFKNQTSSIKWSSNTSVEVSGVVTTTNITVAAQDFAGKANTDAILAAVSAGTIADAPAAQWTRNSTFGSEAYLPAGGELTMIANNKDEISACSDLIGGNLKAMFKSDYWYPWTSTQTSADRAWHWPNYLSRLSSCDKSYNSGYSYALGCVAL